MDDQELVELIKQWLRDEEEAAIARADNIRTILRMVDEISREEMQ